ncbi:MAG TPA: fibronectin type III domain-containing protein [Bryobacteraceae bacterium]|nr:fibronectin type III domain-containing protein [Bryobacteraceae bacterium]
MTSIQRHALAASVTAISIMLAACGTPGAPQPPSLNLPDQVADLDAVRAGSRVSLTWTMPKRNTDRLPLKSDVDVRICRREGDGACQPIGSKLMLAPGKDGSFDDPLPPQLTSGVPRPLRYFVELKNQKGRSAGLSNEALVLAGEAPPPVEGLHAEVRKDGIVLSWNPQGDFGAVRLQRRLLTPPAPQPHQQLFAPPPEAAEVSLLVDTSPQIARAIDKDIRLGHSYEYRAQHVSRVAFEGKTLELDGEFSPSIRVDAVDVFPPAVPTGLAAIVTAAGPGIETAIDLSWQPVTDPDLAGYIVYRHEAGVDWQRVSPSQPVAGPAFHDNHVGPGHTYRYAVSAISLAGHESPRSAEAEETVPDR